MLQAEKTPAPHDRVHPLISNGTRSLVDKLSKMLLRQSPEQHGKNFICPFLALAEQALAVDGLIDSASAAYKGEIIGIERLTTGEKYTYLQELQKEHAAELQYTRRFHDKWPCLRVIICARDENEVN